MGLDQANRDVVEDYLDEGILDDLDLILRVLLASV